MRMLFAERFLYPEDREWFQDATSLEIIREHFEEETEFELHMRVCVGGMPIYYQMHFRRGEGEYTDSFIYEGRAISFDAYIEYREDKISKSVMSG